jgi:hypothetical protein
MSSSEPKVIDPRLTAKVTETMKEAIKAKAIDGKITCAVLRKYAEDNGVDYLVAGTAADLAGVRVHNCGLGCF